MVVDLANLPGPNPEVEEGTEGDISETDEKGSPAVKIKTCEKFLIMKMIVWMFQVLYLSIMQLVKRVLKRKLKIPK